MKFLRLFESFQKRDFSQLDVVDVENQLLELTDYKDIVIVNSCREVLSMPHIYGKIYQQHNYIRHLRKMKLYDDKRAHVNLSDYDIPECESILIDIIFNHPRGRVKGNLYIEGYVKGMLEHYLNPIYSRYDVNIYVLISETNQTLDPMCELKVLIQPNNYILPSM